MAITMNIRYEAAKGNYWENYVGRFGKWVKVSRIKYLWLKWCGYKVKQIKNGNKFKK